MTQNNPEQCQADFWSCLSNGGVFFHTPLPLAACGFTRRAPQPMKVVETGGSGPSSSSLSPCAGGDLHQQQKRNNQLILVLFFVFQSTFVFCFFRSAPVSLPPLFSVSGDRI
uniref:Transmembrane protein n=1 Tax=Populus davidiana TaxID=266767 RepID=A0A6M2F3G9_9ROSI